MLPALVGTAGRLLLSQGAKGAATNLAKGAVKNVVKNKITGSNKNNKLLGGKSSEEGGAGGGGALVPYSSGGSIGGAIVPYSSGGSSGGALAIRSFIPDKKFKISTKTATVTKKGSLLEQILSEIISLKGSFSALQKAINEKNAADRKAAADYRKFLEKQKRDNREKELETKEKDKEKEKEKKKNKGFSLFGFIANFLGNILLGGILKLLLNNQKPIFEAIDVGLKNWRLITRVLLDKKFRAPFFKLLKFTAKVLLNPLYLPAKILKTSFKLTGKAIKGTFGGVSKLIRSTIRGGFNIASKVTEILSQPLGALPRKGVSPTGPVSTAGKIKQASSMSRYLNDPVGRKILKTQGHAAYNVYQNAVQNAQASGLNRTQAALKGKHAVSRAIRKGLTPQAMTGSLAGGVKGSNILKGGVGQSLNRGALKVFGKSNVLAAKSAALAVKGLLRRIPIIGPLLVGIDSYMNGDSVYQETDGKRGISPGKLDYTLFKAFGAALGGFAGSFIPIPVLGPLLGELVGEYVGELFYILLKGGGIQEVGNKLQKDIRKVLDAANVAKDWLMQGVSNIQKQDGGPLDNFLPFKLGGWATLLNPFEFNLFKKLDILRKSFFPPNPNKNQKYQDSSSSTRSSTTAPRSGGGGGGNRAETYLGGGVPGPYGIKSNFSPIVQDIFSSGKANPNTKAGRGAAAAMIAIGQMETNYPYSQAYTGRGGLDGAMQGFIQLSTYSHPQSAFTSKENYLNYVVPKFTGKSTTFTGSGRFDPEKFYDLMKNAKTGKDVRDAVLASGFNGYDFQPLRDGGWTRLIPEQVEAIKQMMTSGQSSTPSANPQATPSANPQATPAVVPRNDGHDNSSTNSPSQSSAAEQIQRHDGHDNPSSNSVMTPSQQSQGQPSITGTASGSGLASVAGQYASYETPGGKIIPLPIPLGGQQPNVVSNNSPPMVMGGVSASSALNSYYRAQLLGFLYKQG